MKKSEHSPHIETKTEFFDRLRSCDRDLLNLFGCLKAGCVDGCEALITSWGYTNKPDFRIFRNHIIAEMVLKPHLHQVRVMLRVVPVKGHVAVYQHKVRSLVITDCKEKTDRLPWVEFYVSNPAEADEAVELFRLVATEWAARDK